MAATSAAAAFAAHQVERRMARRETGMYSRQVEACAQIVPELWAGQALTSFYVASMRNAVNDADRIRRECEGARNAYHDAQNAVHLATMKALANIANAVVRVEPCREERAPNRAMRRARDRQDFPMLSVHYRWGRR